MAQKVMTLEFYTTGDIIINAEGLSVSGTGTFTGNVATSGTGTITSASSLTAGELYMLMRIFAIQVILTII